MSDLERFLTRRAELRWQGLTTIAGLGVGMGFTYFVVTLVLGLAELGSRHATFFLALVTAVSVAVAVTSLWWARRTVRRDRTESATLERSRGIPARP